MDGHPGSRGRALRLFGIPVLLAVVALVVALTVASSPVLHTTGSDLASTRATASSTGRAGQHFGGNAAPLDPVLGSLVDPARPWLAGQPGPDLPAVQDLLDARGRAVLDRDIAAYVATASARTSVADAARDQASALLSLPVTHFSFTLGVDGTSEIVDGPATTTARSTYGPDAYVLHATLRYRLGGYDRGIVSTPHLVTIGGQDGAWVVLDDVPADGSREIWDFGPLTVVRGERSLVVGYGDHGPSPATLRQYAAAADVGVRDVTSEWGTDWQRRVLVVAPSTRAELGATLGRRVSDFRRIAAVTTARFASTSTVSHGDRVFLNPKAFAQLGPRGRTILLRHEITHVATNAGAADAMPTWMEEGFADHLGYLGSGVSTAAITAELRRWVRAGGRPAVLPADDDYDGGNGDLVETYEQSWLATHLLAQRYGERRLVELYRAMLADTARNPATGTDDAFRSVLGVSLASFTRQWSVAVVELGRA